MLAVILKILSVIGIILLFVLGMLLALFLLVLFFPVYYKIQGKKDSQKAGISLRASWLFGLVRVRCAYPVPGNITARLLFFKIFDSSAEKTADGSSSKDQDNADAAENQVKYIENTGGSSINSEGLNNNESTRVNEDESSRQDGSAENIEKKNIFSGLSSKYKKFEYTIQKIYDKIKEIRENTDFYKKLLEEENTKALLKHASIRLCRILKNIRPRRLKADIVFGAATPDVTGYIYGIYGMVCSSLGRNFYLEPDFTRQVFEGSLLAAGHITVFTILFNAAMVVFDKRLKILRRKLKSRSSGKNKDGNQRKNHNQNH